MKKIFIEKLTSKNDFDLIYQFISPIEKLLMISQQKNKLFIFLGAGFSSHFKLPNWNLLIDNIIQDIMYCDTVMNSKYKTDIQLYLLKLKFSDDGNKIRISLINQLLMCKLESNEILYESLCKNLKLNENISNYSSISNHELELLKKFGKINAVFCTTNFDNVLKEVLDIENQIIKYEEYFNYGKTGIIHIHGALSKTNKFDFIEDLVFDFTSYVDKYNIPKNQKNLLKKIIEEDKIESASILFLGSSLQEPELIGLISDETVFSNKYAILGFDSKSDFDIVYTYYYQKYNIEILGYNSSLNHNLFSVIINAFCAKLGIKNPRISLDELDRVLSEECD